MKILPIVLATWAYKNRVNHECLEQIRDDKKTCSNSAALILSHHSARFDYSDTEVPPDQKGNLPSRFQEMALRTVGDDAWDSLKSRLGENGVRIDDDKVAALAAGFYAERKLQQITGTGVANDLHSELTGDLAGMDEHGAKWQYDAAWVRELEANPDAEAIAEECYADVSSKFPLALSGPEMEYTTKLLNFDPSIVEVSL